MNNQQIKPYFLIKEGVDWYYYLHVRGGTAENGTNGGQYGFCIFYLTPEDSRKMNDLCPRAWCKDNNIAFGTGDTIEIAYENYINKLPNSHPLKQ